MITKDEVIQKAADFIFGKPLVTNVYRSVLVEAIIDIVLPDWDWCAADYASHDFVHRPDRIRLEVKQSALKQSWETKTPAKPSWDIKPRTGEWLNGTWVPGKGRKADIYVLALHRDYGDGADHRDPTQWRFFVILASDLPKTQRLQLKKAQLLAQDVGVEGLATEVEKLRIKCLAHR